VRSTLTHEPSTRGGHTSASSSSIRGPIPPSVVVTCMTRSSNRRSRRGCSRKGSPSSTGSVRTSSAGVAERRGCDYCAIRQGVVDWLCRAAQVGSPHTWCETRPNRGWSWHRACATVTHATSIIEALDCDVQPGQIARSKYFVSKTVRGDRSRGDGSSLIGPEDEDEGRDDSGAIATAGVRGARGHQGLLSPINRCAGAHLASDESASRQLNAAGC
jgi:hypothetical protein